MKYVVYCKECKLPRTEIEIDGIFEKATPNLACRCDTGARQEAEYSTSQVKEEQNGNIRVTVTGPLRHLTDREMAIRETKRKS